MTRADHALTSARTAPDEPYRRMPLQGFELAWTDGPAPAHDTRWIPAVVPGGVHESLLAAGDMSGHPYFGTNEDEVAWIEQKTWWYRTSFAAPNVGEDERLSLTFEGIDTVAEVWLNGRLVGSHANQHRPLTIDVTGTLADTNELLVRIAPPLDDVLAPAELEAAADYARRRREVVRPGAPEQSIDELTLPTKRSLRRKATYSWGWDFAPRIPSLGLYREVVLTRARGARLLGTYARTTALDTATRSATVTVDIDVELLAVGSATVAVTLTSPSGERTEATAAAHGPVRVELHVEDADLWWTHDLGGQPLYDLAVTLVHEDEVVDTASLRIGIRTIELDRGADDVGRRFGFVLNGVPVFSRGANWVPASMLVGSVPDSTYRALVSLARDGAMNMLRIWGGGIYEPDVFYDVCDELGVLVWQDFMFACFDYPSDNPVLQRETELEAAYQVGRLGSHACIAVWCGNNEVHGIHEWTAGNLEPGNWGWSLFHEILPAAVERHAPGAIYWPGSPWAETPQETVNGVTDGDRHAWEVWHGVEMGAGGPSEFATRGEAVHFHRYAHDTGKFISEFGIHAAPELATLERWTPPGSLELRNDAFDHRNKDTPKDKGYALMEHETGIPTTMEQYVDFSMACQAEGLKFGVEHYRRRQPHCQGTLVWQFNDPWPGFSWSVVDHDLVPKAGYYFLQRAYQPVIASFRTGPAGLELWATNSGTSDVPLDLVVDVARFDGRSLLRDTVSVVAGAYTSGCVWSTSAVYGPGEYAWVSSPDAAIPDNRAFFGPLKELPLRGRLQSEVTWTSDSSAEVELASTGYSYFAHVLSPHPGVRFDTNYLDLRDGDRRVIRVSGLRRGAELRVAAYDQPAR